MARVRVLEKSVAERIAAGEVVERPSSVVKELVENSLDAAASRVTVELQNGGSTLLRVVDDGHGMSPEDARLAIERHATSKISDWDDMDALMTLGFRGEALPSIAAVARLEIFTCEPGAEEGTEVRVEGGEIVRVGPAAAVPGTRVTVRDLFFNTPARRKFLRSPAAETAQVVDLVGRLAVAWPEVHFRVLSNGKELLALPAGLSTAERLARMWRIAPDRLVPVRGEGDGLHVDGLVALPSESRNNRSTQIFVMNGRVIRSNSLSQAVQEGFSPLLERGRFPVGMLRLTVDPTLVDVNVHPTKAEVRFAHPRPVFTALYRAVARALEGYGADTVVHRHLQQALDGPGPDERVDIPPPASTWSPDRGRGPAWREGEGPPGPPPPGAAGPPFSAERTGTDRAPHERAPWRAPVTAPPPPTRAVLDLFRPLDDEGQADRVADEGPPAGLPRFQPLAQLHRTFLVGLVDGELWVIDQHTAHERINYERLGRLEPMGSRSQGLLVPEVVELTPPQAAFLAGHLDDFRDLGFQVEPFGGDAFQLRGVPLGLPPRRVQEAFRAVVEEAADGAPSVRGAVSEGFRERLRALVACKVSIKAGDPLTPPEMTRLVEDMLAVEHSRYCPHGRPTRILLDRRTLERLFHR